MGLWSDRVVQPLMDRALGSESLSALRREVLADASGRILEIGFGSGLSISCYPPAVRGIVALDPSPGRRARAQTRIAESGRTVHYETRGAESLPFEDQTFDTVVSLFTLCTIDGLDQALGEVRRVLRPGGAFLFLEHGIAPDVGVQRIQRLLNPLQRLVAEGCQLIKDQATALEAAGLRVERRRSFYFDGMPRPIGWFTLGLARR